MLGPMPESHVGVSWPQAPGTLLQVSRPTLETAARASVLQLPAWALVSSHLEPEHHLSLTIPTKKTSGKGEDGAFRGQRIKAQNRRKMGPLEPEMERKTFWLM